VSPRDLREHRFALKTFDETYAAYLVASQNGETDQRWRLREEVDHLLPAAQTSLNASRVNVVITPPSHIGGIVHQGLPNTVFLHEQDGVYGDVPRLIFDTVRVADGYLAEQEKALARKRRNPLYWIDRFLRAVLGLPAYLLSLILGVPAARIAESPLGTALRVAEVILTAFLVYFGGQTAGWW
jgi:hypothetical protein